MAGVKPLEIPLQDLLSATNDFAKENQLGSGRYHSLYKGESRKYGTIAIKRIIDHERSSQGASQFKREIASLSIYKHENVVSLFGVCSEADEKILVYKYESRQSLDKHLQSTNLSWTQRLKICLDAAHGLKYLHHEHRLIHRDVKSGNILLDEKMNAKISDFGLYKEGVEEESSFVISNACGTGGYIDPDYSNTGLLTQKSDVFSFGIVLFEVLCGKPAFVRVDGQSFYSWVQKHFKRQTLETIIYTSLKGKINAASLATFLAIAGRCLGDGEKRPTMKEVVEQLQKALDEQLPPSRQGSEDVYDNDALFQKRDVLASRIMDNIKLSYDGLQPHEKQLFLDIACFFDEEPVDFAMPILDAFGFHPTIGLKVLTEKSLITVSNGKFHMHDLVKQMAHNIVRGDHPDDPCDHTRVWQDEDVKNICVIRKTEENHKIEALYLRNSFYNEHFPRLVANMKNLRCLSWTKSYKDSLHINFHPTKLHCLMLREGSQEQLWEGYKHLPFLKILNLSNSEKLIRTPDFKGLPSLERLILKGCIGLKEIHPSIGYLERLASLDVSYCTSLEKFPPIIQMRRLETLDLTYCVKLTMFPEIRTRMDSLVELSLACTAIEIVPPTVGQYCTNLVSFNLNSCDKLKRIEFNFRHLEQLKDLQLYRAYQIDKLAFFDSFRMRVPQFLRLLRKLNLSCFLLRDGDIIPSGVLDQLLNLQELDLSFNSFSRLPSLSRLQSLKCLGLSHCSSLVEIPDLPPSITVLNATSCSSLKKVEDLSIYKSLWKVSLFGCEKLASHHSVERFMVQETMVRNTFMSLKLPVVTKSAEYGEHKYTLQLPQNWDNNFSGFLLCIGSGINYSCSITIRHEETSMVHPQPDEWKEFDRNMKKGDQYGQVGYVSFASLKHISWWNSTYNFKLSFYLDKDYKLKVGLVPKWKLGNSTEFWDEEVEGSKTFNIIEKSSSSMEIQWSGGYTI